ncbi:serine/arginine repetitive matrix protein 4 [Engraulis encrasicolus]|uniref:serine/arginine repetitive matrix protein 4 n=1 Tax=Engraulis encrasicolus TaxID=184585 RepID=UPI002FD212B2
MLTTDGRGSRHALPHTHTQTTQDADTETDTHTQQPKSPGQKDSPLKTSTVTTTTSPSSPLPSPPPLPFRSCPTPSCTPAGSRGGEGAGGGGGGAMASSSVREQGRLLFQKFWEGTFRAVAMPRPESIIMASITAGRSPKKSDASISLPSKFTEKDAESKESEVVARHHSGRAKKRGRKHRSHHRARRTPSYSPSPVRRKKKKKKSSKKHKQHRQHLQDVSDPLQPTYLESQGDSRRRLDSDQRALDWRTATVKLASKTSPHFDCTASDSTTRPQQDYDSGNDTSSPPSSKTGISRSNVSRLKSALGRVEGDSASDSGNSVTSYVSLCKPAEGTPSSSIVIACRQGGSGVCKSYVRAFSSSLTPLRERQRGRSSSRHSSRSPSTASSRYSASCSRSPSRSTGRRSYSRSSCYSADSRKDSVCSARLSKYSPSRDDERRTKDRSSGDKRSKHGRKRHRRKSSYSPMRKRRRDSPSHLEARRITSARKRPVPYFRPSPSSCSTASSVISLTSLFGIVRSHSQSRSRSRSRSWNFVVFCVSKTQ